MPSFSMECITAELLPVIIIAAPQTTFTCLVVDNLVWYYTNIQCIQVQATYLSKGRFTILTLFVLRFWYNISFARFVVLVNRDLLV